MILVRLKSSTKHQTFCKFCEYSAISSLKLREWLQYGGRNPFEGLPGFNGLVEGIAPSTAQKSRKTQKGLPFPNMMKFKNFRYLTFHTILEI
jgi:hypothetical protein